MAKHSFQVPSYSPTATSDGTALTSLTFQSIEATNATAYSEVLEVYIGGQATASAVNLMVFARNSTTVANASPLLTTTGVDGYLRSYGQGSNTVTTYVAAGTPPARTTAVTQARLALTMNAFGGIVRWVAAPGEEWGILGQASANGTTPGSSLSNGSASGVGNAGSVASHIIYESY
jgi:hypothetical protein